MTPPPSAATATAPAISASAAAPHERGPKPIIDGHRGNSAQFAIYAFTLIPLLAVAIAIPFAWGWV